MKRQIRRIHGITLIKTVAQFVELGTTFQRSLVIGDHPRKKWVFELLYSWYTLALAVVGRGCSLGPWRARCLPERHYHIYHHTDRKHLTLEEFQALGQSA